MCPFQKAKDMQAFDVSTWKMLLSFYSLGPCDREDFEGTSILTFPSLKHEGWAGVSPLRSVGISRKEAFLVKYSDSFRKIWVSFDSVGVECFSLVLHKANRNLATASGLCWKRKPCR